MRGSDGLAGGGQRDDETLAPTRTRLLVEVWWETRDRRRARPVLRGWVRVLPDGPRRAFSRPRQLTHLIREATRPGDPPGQQE